MKYRIFTTSEKAWNGMLEAMVTAEQSIYIEMYILETDEEGIPFFSELEKAARRGVQVIVMLDVVGSDGYVDGFMNDAIGGLREAGAEVIFVSSFFRRLHRKIFIIDQRLAFVGGVNIGKKFAKWRDLQILVTGRVVEHILGAFAGIYQENGGKTKIPGVTVRPVAPKRTSIVNRARLWFLDHRKDKKAGKNGDIFGAYYADRIKSAKKSIIFVTPYLLPPRWFIAQIHQALMRGVRVEILLPVSTDHRFINAVNHSYAQCLNDLGAVMYFSQGMNHAKAMLVDADVTAGKDGESGGEGVIGSQNLDLLSFHMNLEAGIFFKDPEMVRELSAILDGWKKQSVAYAPGQDISAWYEHFIGFLLKLLGFLPFGYGTLKKGV